jgi:glycosyltransferase involved in cell wall biosynthesis
MPEVSVLLAARDEADVVGRAVESILAQTFDDWELVFVDDGSSDGTIAVVESFGDPRIRVHRLSRAGLSKALNAGLAIARGPFVARQDADDWSLPERLERQVAFLRAHPGVAVVGSAWIELGADGQRARPRARVVTGRLNDVLPQFNPITHTTAIFRREVVVSAGGYDEAFSYGEDYDLWLRLAHEGEVLWNLPDELAVRTMSGTNMSSQRERAQLVQELRIRSRDVRRRRQAGQPVSGPAARLALRSAVLLAPLSLRRVVRRKRGKVP